MYDIFTCVWLIHMVHLGKYTLQALQGCYGFYTLYITYIKKKTLIHHDVNLNNIKQAHIYHAIYFVVP